MGDAQFTILFRKSNGKEVDTSLAIRLQLLSCWSYSNIDGDKQCLSRFHPETTMRHIWPPPKKKKGAVTSEANLNRKGAGRRDP